MKIGLSKWLVLGICLLGCTGCNWFCSRFATAVGIYSQDWAFVQSVGGLAIGTPTRAANGHVMLPILCDVSGLKKITRQPTVINSSIACDPPSVLIQEHSIFITIRTTIPAKLHHNATCPPADLGLLATGTYNVFYLNPNVVCINPNGTQMRIEPATIPKQQNLGTVTILPH